MTKYPITIQEEPMGKTYSGDIKGDLTIYAGDDASKLTSVGGGLYIDADAGETPLPADA
jgi:hypothetical protein